MLRELAVISGAIGALVVAAALGTPRAAAAPDQAAHFADADDIALVDRGAGLYQRYCGGCHGRRLEGQALWQLKDQYVGRRAPPQDATGHTWQHPDEDLFHMTKYGRFAAAPADLKSYMPAFEHALSDDDVVAVLAFIKSQWPTGIRASQSMLNPGFRGMPAGADKVEWTLPPNCTASIQLWSQTEPDSPVPSATPKRPASSGRR
jgi:mono/diheme cytochrome c family protein